MSLLLSILVSMASSPQNTEFGVVTYGTNCTGCLSNSLIRDMEPSCGYYNKDKVINSFGIKTSEIPWHAGIYDKEARIINTGTIISKRVVVTAVEVFYYEEKAQLPTSRYAVAVGNIDCDIYKMRDRDDSQILDVDRIIFHPEYTGESTQYRHNLALVVAAKEFSYTDNVRPACLSFDPKFDAEMLREAADSKVDLLSWDTCHRAISAKYINNDECKKRFTMNDTAAYFNEDTFCAEGFGKGSQCTAGSGAGIIFPARVGGTERYFLRGVSAEVSIKAEGNARIFTHIMHYENFIKSVLDFKEIPAVKYGNINTVLNITMEVK